MWAAWILGTLAATALIGFKLQSKDRGVFVPGQTTSGHYQIELACDRCHKPYQGVSSEACVKCHDRELKEAEDSHPKSKFIDPRNAERIARLDATSCIACHVEHRPSATGAMGVTLPADMCFYCHSDVAKERPSHKDMAFNTCASGGCHNFHDNRALYADFLVKHQTEPDVLNLPAVAWRKMLPDAAPPLTASEHDSPAHMSPALLDQWASTGHAHGGVNCTGCHMVADGPGKSWTDHPGYGRCQGCHRNETEGFLGGKHGMRLASGLPPMSPALARLPMAGDASKHLLGCSSCHAPHDFDTRRAAADACLECHADKHSLAYEASPHFALWRAEIAGAAAAGTGVSCATCHLPRVPAADGDARGIRVQHNQNANLRPNEKMIRDVCLSCHGLSFSLDALADPLLVEVNFRGRPARHIESIGMAVRKAAK